MAVQTHLTSVELTWSPPTPLGDTTGYRIYYSGGSSGSVNVSGDSTDNYLLTGLQNGDSYSISLMATSQHFFSDALIQEVTLSKIHKHNNSVVLMYRFVVIVFHSHISQSQLQTNQVSV